MKQTPLYPAHSKYGARMVDFAGWNMPIQYEGIAAEHLAVRRGAGLFDVSHMGEVRVTGGGATDFLRFATLNDPAKLTPGRGQYSMLPNDKGGLIDDLYIYCEDEDDYLVVCNAANTPQVVPHLQKLSGDYDARVVDESSEWALLALQGPRAEALLEPLVDTNLSALKKNRMLETTLQSAPIKVARTGYTGEDGFEIFCRPDGALGVWEALTAAGAVPCGLGARDTLRLEAGFPLYGHEFTKVTNPRCSSYAWVVKDKPFYGRDALWNNTCGRKLVGLMLERGIAREGYGLFLDGERVGEVTSGTVSPLTKKSIAMGWVDAEHAQTGTALTVEIRGRHVPATVADPPFYTP